MNEMTTESKGIYHWKLGDVALARVCQKTYARVRVVKDEKGLFYDDKVLGISGNEDGSITVTKELCYYVETCRTNHKFWLPYTSLHLAERSRPFYGSEKETNKDKSEVSSKTPAMLRKKKVEARRKVSLDVELRESNDAEQSIDDPDQSISDSDQNINESDQSICDSDQNINMFDQSICDSDQNINETDQSICDSDQNIYESDQSICGSDQNINESDQSICGSDQNINESDQSICDSDQNINESDQSICDSDQNIYDSDQCTDDSDQCIDDSDHNIDESDQSIDDSDQSINDSGQSDSGYSDQRINNSDQSINGSDQSINNSDQSINSSDESINDSDQSINSSDQSINESDPDTSMDEESDSYEDLELGSKYIAAYKKYVRGYKDMLLDQYVELLIEENNEEVNNDCLKNVLEGHSSTKDKSQHVIKVAVTEKQLDKYVQQCWRYNRQKKRKLAVMSEIGVKNKLFDPSDDESVPVHIKWCLVCGRNGNTEDCDICPAAFHAMCAHKWLHTIKQRKNPPNKPPKIISSTRCITTEGNEDKSICPSCMWGPQVGYDDIVWNKLSMCGWWPARVLTPGEVPLCLHERPHSAQDLPLRYYGTLNHSWGNLSRTCLFLPSHTRSLAGAMVDLQEAVLDAYDDYITAYLT